MVIKRFQRTRQVSFPLIDPDWVIDLLFEKLTPQIGDWIWKTPFQHFASGVGDFMYSL